jgi:hypothetical protein
MRKEAGDAQIEVRAFNGPAIFLGPDDPLALPTWPPISLLVRDRERLSRLQSLS